MIRKYVIIFTISLLMLLWGCTSSTEFIDDKNNLEKNIGLCTDSDGGEDIYTAGTAMVINKSSNRYNYPLAYDYCLDGLLYEAVCNDKNAPVRKSLRCPEGTTCSKRICASDIDATSDYIPMTCYDSDGGLNTKEKGWTLDTGFATADFCCAKDANVCEVNKIQNGNQLREHYCENGERKYKTIECQCEDGECIEAEASQIQSEIPTIKQKIEIPTIKQKIDDSSLSTKTNSVRWCKDSDGGMNYYMSGENIFQKETESEILIRKDSCFSKDKLLEYFCYNGLPTMLDRYCPYGCKDGSCISDCDSGGSLTRLLPSMEMKVKGKEYMIKLKALNEDGATIIVNNQEVLLKENQNKIFKDGTNLIAEKVISVGSGVVEFCLKV